MCLYYDCASYNQLLLTFNIYYYLSSLRSSLFTLLTSIIRHPHHILWQSTDEIFKHNSFVVHHDWHVLFVFACVDNKLIDKLMIRTSKPRSWRTSWRRNKNNIMLLRCCRKLNVFWINVLIKSFLLYFRFNYSNNPLVFVY